MKHTALSFVFLMIMAVSNFAHALDVTSGCMPDPARDASAIVEAVKVRWLADSQHPMTKHYAQFADEKGILGGNFAVNAIPFYVDDRAALKVDENDGRTFRGEARYLVSVLGKMGGTGGGQVYSANYVVKYFFSGKIFKGGGFYCSPSQLVYGGPVALPELQQTPALK